MKLHTAGEETVLINVVRTDAGLDLPGKKLLYGKDGLRWGRLNSQLENKITAKVWECWGKNGLEKINFDENSLDFFISPFGPPPRLLILGGGHIGAALSHLAAVLDLEIIVVDDRPFFASSQQHPHAHQVVCDSFNHSLDMLSLTTSDHIAIVTRGHRYDLLCLEKILSREKKTGNRVAYIGLIGSRSRVRALLGKLADDGFDEKELARIYTPIGIDIGAETEGEIAISILAEITKVRKKEGFSSLKQMELLKELVNLEQSGERAALVTIINTFGSAPRKAGTQMLVYPDGRIIGTIGGGCGEADVKREALHVLDQGCCRTYRLNLTNDLAEQEGMACGGIMDLFLEPVN